MTTTDETNVEPPDDSAEPTSTPEAPAVATSDDEASPNREAARYRTQLRTVEAERDTLAATVAMLRTQAAEAALGGILARPATLWGVTGTTAGDYYDQDGTLDTAALAAAARTAISEHGLAGATNGIVFASPTTEREADAEHARGFESAFAPRH